MLSNTFSTRGRETSSHTKNNLKICRSTPVEHGSHNVSRWMTWLSISLKNAAACDKWYQLQNHSITESLNANGAWEKPFVGHPRACHSQCRTNKTKAPCVFVFRDVHSSQPLEKQEPELRRGTVIGARPFGLVFAVWSGGSRKPLPVPSREAGAAKLFQKKHCVFSLHTKTLSCLQT